MTQAADEGSKTGAKPRKRRKRQRKPAAVVEAAVVAEQPSVRGPDEDVSPVNPVGRPTGFKPEYVAQAEKLCALGATDAEIADFFDVTPRTIHRWKLQFEEFCHALKTGKDLADERVQRSLFHRASGFVFVEQQAFKLKTVEFNEAGKRVRETEEVRVVDVERMAIPDTTAGIFWLKNRRKDEWRDVQGREHTGLNGGPIESAEKPRSPGEDHLAELGQRYGKPLQLISGGKK